MEETNQAFQVFRKALQKALTHLFDPDYAIPQSLMFLVQDSSGLQGNLRSILVRAIQALETDSDALTMSRTQRSYSILKLRYLDGLSQETTAEQLQMSLHLCR